MEVEEVEFNKFCRCCFSSDEEDMVDIFKKGHDHLYFEFSHLPISPEDLYSNYICISCVAELSHWKKFKKKCLESRSKYHHQIISINPALSNIAEDALIETNVVFLQESVVKEELNISEDYNEVSHIEKRRKIQDYDNIGHQDTKKFSRSVFEKAVKENAELKHKLQAIQQKMTEVRKSTASGLDERAVKPEYEPYGDKCIYSNFDNIAIDTKIKDEIEQMSSDKEYDNHFINTMLRSLFTPEELRNSSATGKAAKKGQIVKPPLSPRRKRLLSDYYKWRIYKSKADDATKHERFQKLNSKIKILLINERQKKKKMRSRSVPSTSKLKKMIKELDEDEDEQQENDDDEIIIYDSE